MPKISPQHMHSSSRLGVPFAATNAGNEPLTHAVSACKGASSPVVLRCSLWRRFKAGVSRKAEEGTCTAGARRLRLLPCPWLMRELPAAQDYTLGQLQQNEALRARQLCKTLSQLGPSFVKIGQALSSRPDLLPQVYLEVHPSLMLPNVLLFMFLQSACAAGAFHCRYQSVAVVMAYLLPQWCLKVLPAPLVSAAEIEKHACGRADDPVLTHCKRALLLRTCGVALEGIICLLQTLSELQDRLPPFPTEIALQLIEEDLGQPASAIMSVITPEPVAAASLGQVHVTHPHGLTLPVRQSWWLPLAILDPIALGHEVR